MWRMPLHRWKAKAQVQPNRNSLPYQAPAWPVKHSQLAGPSISASRPLARTRAPPARTMPVARCRIEVTIWTCQRYTCRWGDRGRSRLIRCLGCAGGPPAWLVARHRSEVDAASVLFPIPVAGRLRTLASAELRREHLAGVLVGGRRGFGRVLRVWNHGAMTYHGTPCNAQNFKPGLTCLTTSVFQAP